MSGIGPASARPWARSGLVWADFEQRGATTHPVAARYAQARCARSRDMHARTISGRSRSRSRRPRAAKISRARVTGGRPRNRAASARHARAGNGTRNVKIPRRYPIAVAILTTKRTTTSPLMMVTEVKIENRTVHSKARQASTGHRQSPKAPIGKRLLIVGFLLLAATERGQALTCFSSADAVRQDNSRAWPSWTLRAPGHEGSKCWYATTSGSAHEHRNVAAASIERPLARRSRDHEIEVTGAAVETPVEDVPERRSFLGASFDDRFLAVLDGTPPYFGADRGRIIEMFRNASLQRL